MKFKIKKENILLFLFFIILLSLIFVKDPWHDELFTKYLISHSPEEILEILKNDNGPPFYYYLLHFLTYPFKNSLLSIRFFSIIFVILSIPFLKRILENLKIKSIPSYIFLFFPIPMYFATEARAYALVLLLSTLLFYEITGKERKLFIIIYSTLLIYTHYFSLIFLTYLFSVFLFKKKKDYLILILIILILSSPLIFLIKVQPKDSLSWTDIYLKKSSPFYFFLNFNFFYRFNFEPFKPNIFFFIFTLLNILLIIFAFQKKDLNFINFGFLLNYFLLFLISFSYKNFYVPFKTETFFKIPFFLIIFSVLSLEKRFFPLIKNLYFAIILFSSINTAYLISTPLPANEQIKEILKLPENWTNVCIVGNWGLLANYYVEKENLKVSLFIFPPSQKKHLGWYINKPIDPKEVEWLKKEVMFSEKPFLIIWHKNDPYSINVKRYLSRGARVFYYGDFWFTFLNQPVPAKLLNR